MADEPVKVKDCAQAAIIDKPYHRTPEHIAELNRRRQQAPQRWYPLAVKRGWSDILPEQSWVKIVHNRGRVTIGEIFSESRDGYVLLSLHPDSVLVDGDFDEKYVTPLMIRECLGNSSIIQVFTDNEAIAQVAKRDNGRADDDNQERQGEESEE